MIFVKMNNDVVTEVLDGKHRLAVELNCRKSTVVTDIETLEQHKVSLDEHGRVVKENSNETKSNQ